MFVTSIAEEKETLRAIIGAERTRSWLRDRLLPVRSVATDYLLRRSFLGRTTQRAKSPMKAPAAAMANILGVPPNSL